MTAPSPPTPDKQSMHPGEGKPIMPALKNVGFIGQDNLDEVLDSGQTDLDFMSEVDGVPEQPEQEQVPPDSIEEQPETQETPAQTDETATEDHIELPEHVTLEQLEEENPGLAKVYRSMQADYTRKTQALAEQRKELTEAEQKALAWDQLSSNQELVGQIKAYVEQRENGTQQPQQPMQQPTGDYGSELDDLDLDQGQRSAVERMIKQSIETEVRPYVQDLYAREVNRELKHLETDIPGFKENYEAIKQHRTNNGNRQTWAEAARDFLFDQQRDAGRREALEALSRKKRVASVSEPPTSVVPQTSAPQSIPDHPTLDESLDIALRQHGLGE